MSFKFTKLEIPEVILVESLAYSDERGFFTEIYKESIFADNGIKTKFVQDNFSYSIKGVLRGLHYQKYHKAQAKLVMVTSGEIFDVAVDIRKDSPTYGKWIGEVLSSQNHKLLYVPEGFAHGFCVLSNDAYVTYKVNSEYSPDHERGIIWSDPELKIKWPIDNPIMIKKDQQLPFLKNADNDFVY
ncbi:MAG: dTDP-4-dehydrorhamnose 3,5-epimerase [Patescibacteria group bacterium]|nr:dTDP-4-dehydrorhamnose 3,5-epimerase [Patescibacteria group bacterium]